jgi:hypothetical protein
MSDEPFYSPTHRRPERQSQPGELLWTMTNGARGSRLLAGIEAEIRRETLAVKGWTPGVPTVAVGRSPQE